MLLQEQSLGWFITLIALGVVFVLGFIFNKRLARRSESPRVRRVVDTVWILTLFALSSWLILTA